MMVLNFISCSVIPYTEVYLALFTLTNNFREITKQESIKNIIYKNIVINYNLK